MKEKMNQMIEEIKKDLIFMANEVEDSIYKAMKALKKQDKKIANEVLKKDQHIDLQEVQIEEKILSLMALQQPVAIDLRFMVSALKMNNDLERIGDHAANIALIAIRLSDQPLLKYLKNISTMSKLSRNMLHDAVNAFIHQDSELAREVCKRDNEVDQLYLQVLDSVINNLQKQQKKIPQGVDLLSVAKDLERIADLATNLGEDVVFMKEARIIRHGLNGQS